MTTRSSISFRGRVGLSFGFALSLAACGEQDERTYEADATDVSGSELIVATPTPGAPDAELPETPMTPVPDDSVEAGQIESTEAEVLTY